MNAERLDPKRTCLLLFDFLVGHAAKDPQRYAPVLANADSTSLSWVQRLQMGLLRREVERLLKSNKSR